MQVEQIVTVKALGQRMKSAPVFKRCLGFDYLDRTPSEATLNRFINLLAGTGILEKTFRRMLRSARKLGLIDGKGESFYGFIRYRPVGIKIIRCSQQG